MDLSVTTAPDRTKGSGLDAHAYLTFATLCFGLSVMSSAPGAGLTVLLATILAAVAFSRIRHGEDLDLSADGRREFRLLLVILVFSALKLLGWSPSWLGTSSEWLERLPGLAWALLAVFLYKTRHRAASRRVMAAVIVTALAVTGVVGLLHLQGARGIGVDVYLLHKSAASAIANGDNPYTDVVEVPNGAPTAEEGDTIVGYPYPPSIALAYSIGQWTYGDPRFTSLVSWLAVLGMIGWTSYRRMSRAGVYALLILAAIPGWALVLRAAWTEPVTLVFLTAAYLWWHRPTSSGVTLGLTLASKQYFALVAPLVLLHRDAGWRRRLIVAGVVIALTVIPFVLLEPAAFWSSAVQFHNETPLRTDSVNLIGAISTLWNPWEPPRWLGPALGVIVAVVTGRLSRTRETFFLGMALALATSFMVASQAFANYWFLITGLCALCLIGPTELPSRTLDEHAIDSLTG